MHTYIYIYIPTYLHPYITFHSIPLHYIPYQTIPYIHTTHHQHPKHPTTTGHRGESQEAKLNTHPHWGAGRHGTIYICICILFHEVARYLETNRGRTMMSPNPIQSAQPPLQTILSLSHKGTPLKSHDPLLNSWVCRAVVRRWQQGDHKHVYPFQMGCYSVPEAAIISSAPAISEAICLGYL